MEDKSPVFLDTNIILRWNVAEAPQHAAVRGAVTLLIGAGHPLWVSVQVMREFAAVMTRPQTFGSPLPESAVAERIRALVARLNVAEETLVVHRKLLGLMGPIQWAANRFTTRTLLPPCLRLAYRSF
ncbi:MAG: hypothetical protein IPK52_23390 [Chloroflexi bacterium]|nr:hypothetical protein [Chloroflexota bacterium]